MDGDSEESKMNEMVIWQFVFVMRMTRCLLMV